MTDSTERGDAPQPYPEPDLDMLRAIFARGLSNGLGQADGQVCIEGAISLACGLPLDDSPPCVAEPDSRFSISINDAKWPSPQARAEALLPLALCQIGTAGTDRKPWVKRIVEGCIRRVVPIYLRHAADVDGMPERHVEALRDAADRCERDGDRSATAAAADAAYTAAAAAAAAAADAAYAAAADAAYAAYAAACGGVCGAAAVDAADVAADAAATPYAAADAVRHRALREMVAVAVEAYAAEGRAP